MIVIIQCAGRKNANAGCLLTADGRQVMFVGDPAAAPPSRDHVYARPDDVSDSGVTWRQALLRYNREGANTLGLLPAVELYGDPVYRRIASRFGAGNTYILSAGWGLIPGTFLTPDYDITFSAVKEKDRYKRRRKRDHYDDFALLPHDTADAITVFASDKYVPLFNALAGGIQAEKTVFYSTGAPPVAPGCDLVKFTGSRFTNWQYDCANAFLDGDLLPQR